MTAKTKRIKKNPTDFLSMRGPSEFMSDITMMRVIDAGLLTKTGKQKSKDSIIADYSERFKAFKKKSKDYQASVMAQVPPGKDNRPPKCPHCGRRPMPHFSDRISMFEYHGPMTRKESREYNTWAHTGDR